MTLKVLEKCLNFTREKFYEPCINPFLSFLISLSIAHPSPDLICSFTPFLSIPSLFFSAHLHPFLQPSFHPSPPASLPRLPPAQKGLLHLSPDVYQEMEASRKQGGSSAPGPGGSSVTYITSKEMGPCSAPLPPGHPPYYSGPASSPSPTATMARELLLNGQSPTADASLPIKGKSPAMACGVTVQPAQQLDYLARIQGFQVR